MCPVLRTEASPRRCTYPRKVLSSDEREVVYFSSMIAWVGCHIDAYEQAK